MSQPAISKHLKKLEDAGLVSRARRATARLSRLEAGPLREVTTWIARYQRFWDESRERTQQKGRVMSKTRITAEPGMPQIVITRDGGKWRLPRRLPRRPVAGLHRADV